MKTWIICRQASDWRLTYGQYELKHLGKELTHEGALGQYHLQHMLHIMKGKQKSPQKGSTQVLCFKYLYMFAKKCSTTKEKTTSQPLSELV